MTTSYELVFKINMSLARDWSHDEYFLVNNFVTKE